MSEVDEMDRLEELESNERIYPKEFNDRLGWFSALTGCELVERYDDDYELPLDIWVMPDGVLYTFIPCCDRKNVDSYFNALCLEYSEWIKHMIGCKDEWK